MTVPALAALVSVWVHAMFFARLHACVTKLENRVTALEGKGHSMSGMLERLGRRASDREYHHSEGD